MAIAIAGHNTGTLEHISLAQIVSVVANHRQGMDETKLQELADSVAAIGVQQPIKVCRREPECLVMVFGHRRVEAAKRAGLDTIPAIVVTDWTDQQIAEAQVIENLLREDLNPIEEALCVQTLLDGGHDLDIAASKMNKSKAWARERHDLLRLADKVQALVASGRLPLGHAKLIARVGDKKDQIDLAYDVIGHCSWAPTKELQRALTGDHVEPLRTLRMAISVKLCKLGVARWPKDVKYAGKRPCDGCTDNTNTEPALFTGITLTSKKGNCTNPKCFAAKAKAWESDPVKIERDKKREEARRAKARKEGKDPDAVATNGGKPEKPRPFPLTAEEHFAVRLHEYVATLIERLRAADANDPAAAIYLAYTLEAAQEYPLAVDLDLRDAADFLPLSEVAAVIRGSGTIPWPARLTSDAWGFVARAVGESEPAYHFFSYSSRPHSVRNVPVPSRVVELLVYLDLLTIRWGVDCSDLSRPTMAEIEAEIEAEQIREMIVSGKRDAATKAMADCEGLDLLMGILRDDAAGKIKLAKWRCKAIDGRVEAIRAGGVTPNEATAGVPATCCVCGKSIDETDQWSKTAATCPDSDKAACSYCVHTITRTPKKRQQVVLNTIAKAPGWLLEKLTADGLRGDWRRAAANARYQELKK